MVSVSRLDPRPSLKARGQGSARLALSSRELDAAYRLLHDRYVEQGYHASDPSGLRFLPHYALPTTYTFVVVNGRDVAGTATLAERGALGLPMESLYESEVSALCSQGRRPAEISGLAFRTSDRLGALKLMRTIVAFAKHTLHVTDLCISVNPAHVVFYKKCFLFEEMGEILPCAEVNGAPAVPLRLDLTVAIERCAEVHPFGIINRHMSPEAMEREGLSYEGLADEIRRGLFEATAARMRFARRWVKREPAGNSPTRRWKASDAQVVAKECGEERELIRSLEEWAATISLES